MVTEIIVEAPLHQKKHLIQPSGFVTCNQEMVINDIQNIGLVAKFPTVCNLKEC
jgi:hypothetical protein